MLHLAVLLNADAINWRFDECAKDYDAPRLTMPNGTAMYFSTGTRTIVTMVDGNTDTNGVWVLAKAWRDCLRIVRELITHVKGKVVMASRIQIAESWRIEHNRFESSAKALVMHSKSQ